MLYIFTTTPRKLYGADVTIKGAVMLEFAGEASRLSGGLESRGSGEGGRETPFPEGKGVPFLLPPISSAAAQILRHL